MFQKKITKTVQNTGDAVETTVKNTIDNIGNTKKNNKNSIQNSTNNESKNMNVEPNQIAESINKTILQTNSMNQSNNSIANDVANILEKKNIMSKDEVSKTTGSIESKFVGKINEVTDALNAAYNKDTTANDNETTVMGSLNNFLNAAKNIGTDTDNEVGKMLNESFKEVKTTPELEEAKDTLVNVTENVQKTIDNYKNVYENKDE